jgi:uncharacterized protein YodC (DUF2158 family)
MAQWKVGDVVQLKSEGPLMTVESISDKGLMCVWFPHHEQDAKRGVFGPDTVKAYVEPRGAFSNDR